MVSITGRWWDVSPPVKKKKPASIHFQVCFYLSVHELEAPGKPMGGNAPRPTVFTAPVSSQHCA